MSTLERLEDSLPYWLEAAKIWKQLANAAGQADAWSKVATIHEQAGRLDEAREAWSSAQQRHRQAGQINGEVYVYGSYVQSKMFHAGVRCTDCHEPHSGRTRFAGNAVCTQCHQATGMKSTSPGSSTTSRGVVRA